MRESIHKAFAAFRSGKHEDLLSFFAQSDDMVINRTHPPSHPEVPTYGVYTGRDAPKQFFTALGAAFLKLESEYEILIADEDEAWVKHTSISATFKKTGKSLQAPYVHYMHLQFRDGKCIRSDIYDPLVAELEYMFHTDAEDLVHRLLHASQTGDTAFLSSVIGNATVQVDGPASVPCIGQFDFPSFAQCLGSNVDMQAEFRVTLAEDLKVGIEMRGTFKTSKTATVPKQKWQNTLLVGIYEFVREQAPPAAPDQPAPPAVLKLKHYHATWMSFGHGQTGFSEWTKFDGPHDKQAEAGKTKKPKKAKDEL